MPDGGSARRPSAWRQARELAERTPETRNRYVDFLRAASIGVVVIGHWVMAAPSVSRDGLTLSDILQLAPWTQWLTWVFQVMPLFFIVGGYANAASWESARRRGEDAASWTAIRLRRLVTPLVPLLLLWSVVAIVARRFDVSPELVRIASQAALIPSWFLAVYVIVVACAPATYWAWRRFGMRSFWGLALGAVAVDAVAFLGDVPLLRWVNYGFVWGGVHQLGYAWREGRLTGEGRPLIWAAGGLLLLIYLVMARSYPVSMITVPGEAISNSSPPTLALLALAVFHLGLVLAWEAPARRWLRRGVPWTATVLVNASIMTLYLWHVTALVLVVGAANLLGGIGLDLPPNSGAWWLTRPAWLVILALALWPLLILFGGFERGARGREAWIAPAWRSLLGAAAVCVGLAFLATGGIADTGALGLRLGVVMLVLAGVVGITGLRRRAQSL